MTEQEEYMEEVGRRIDALNERRAAEKANAPERRAAEEGSNFCRSRKVPDPKLGWVRAEGEFVPMEKATEGVAFKHFKDPEQVDRMVQEAVSSDQDTERWKTAIFSLMDAHLPPERMFDFQDYFSNFEDSKEESVVSRCAVSSMNATDDVFHRAGRSADGGSKGGKTRNEGRPEAYLFIFQRVKAYKKSTDPRMSDDRAIPKALELFESWDRLTLDDRERLFPESKYTPAGLPSVGTVKKYLGKYYNKGVWPPPEWKC